MERVLNWYNLLYLDSPVVAWKLFFLGLTMGMDRTEASQIMRRLNLPLREEREHLDCREAVGVALGKLMHWQEGKSRPSDIFFTLEKLPLEGVLFLMAKSRKDEIRKRISQYLTTWRFHALDITGDDLKKLGLAPGPAFTQILRKVLAAGIDGEAPGRDEQLALAGRLAARVGPEGRV